MKVNILAGFNQERSIPFAAQRAINLYPVANQAGKEPVALFGCAGLEEFTDAGSGGTIRGMFAAANGRAFVVSGSKLYEISESGTATDRGNLDTSSGTVTIDSNGFELFICDGSLGYTFVYATDTFAKVTDADFPSAGTSTFIDGYIVVNENDTGKFYISNLFDANNWDALDFATAESSPDELIRPYNAVGQLWLMGTNTGEVWTNTGDSAFPFARISGAKLEVGIDARYSALEVDNSLFWVGGDKKGRGIVYRTQGFAPQRISTHGIEALIQDAPEKEEIRALTYQEDGHTFYMLTGGGLETSLVYDITTGLWHERAYLNEFGNYEPHLGASHMYAFGKHIMGSRKDTTLYELNSDFYDDAGNPMVKQRVYTHISDEANEISYSEFTAFFEHGTGLTSGQGSDPMAELEVSKDGARTWSNPQIAPMGKKGEYMTKTTFRRIGLADILTLRLTVRDAVKTVIIGSYLK